MSTANRFEGPFRRLVNSAAEEKGSIHDDEEAQKLGFRGGFVPGSIVGTAALRPVWQAFGAQWFEGGWYSFTFVSPVYIDDEVRDEATFEGDEFAIQVVDRAGRLCCNGRAGLGAVAPWETAPTPDADDGGVLPGIDIGHRFEPAGFELDALLCAATIRAAGDDSSLFRDTAPGGAMAPPEQLHVEALHLVSRPDQPRVPRVTGVRGPGMWAQHDLVIDRPLRAGRPYVLNEWVAGKGRSGRTIYLTYAFDVSEDGRVFARGRHKAKWLAAEEEQNT